MNFEVSRLNMLAAAKTVARVAPSGSYSDILNGVLVECNADSGEVYLTATNHAVSIQQKIRASVEESGTVLINAKLLVAMMSKLDGEFVAFSADSPHVLNVVGARCKCVINCLPSKSYPKPIIPFPEESVLMTGICTLSKKTTFAVSNDDSKPSLQCVQVKLKDNALHAASCDGLKMMLVKDKAESSGERELLLPGRSLQLLAAISQDDDMFEVGDIGSEVVFVRGDMIFAIRKISTDEYIDTSSVIQNIMPTYTAIANSDELKEAINLISVASLAGGEKEPINLIFANKEIRLQCNNNHNEASTSVSANVSENTSDAGFFYDVTALKKLFQVVSGKVKLEIDTRGYMLIKTPNEVYLQVPTRPKVKKVKSVNQVA